MKLKPEERKAAAKDLLEVVKHFVAELTAVALKYGLSPDTMLADLGELDDLIHVLERELAEP